MRKAGNRIRATMQLIDVNTEGHLWGEKFDREMGDIFTVQTEIAEKVARALEVKLSPVHVKDTDDVDAYIMYVKAVQLVHAETERSLKEAIVLLDSAISRDPRIRARPRKPLLRVDGPFELRRVPRRRKEGRGCGTQGTRVGFRLGRTSRGNVASPHPP